MNVVMERCAECGKEFNNSSGVGYCVACDAMIRALEPPQTLKDYRHVYEGQTPTNDGQQLLQRIMLQKPQDFLGGKRAEEKAYREALARLKAVPSPIAEPDAEGKLEDEGSTSAAELIQKLIDEARARS